MIETTKLSSKGQVVLPKSIREAHSWPPGTEFTIEDTGSSIILRPTSRFRRTTVDEMTGFLAYSGKAKTVEEMDEAIAEAVRERDARRRY